MFCVNKRIETYLLMYFEYAYDITPYSKWKNSDVSYRFNILSFKAVFYFKSIMLGKNK